MEEEEINPEQITEPEVIQPDVVIINPEPAAVEQVAVDSSLIDAVNNMQGAINDMRLALMEANQSNFDRMLAMVEMVDERCKRIEEMYSSASLAVNSEDEETVSEAIDDTIRKTARRPWL